MPDNPWQKDDAIINECVEQGRAVAEDIVSSTDSGIESLAELMVRMREGITKTDTGDADYEGESQQYRDAMALMLEPIGPAPAAGERENNLRRHVREAATSRAWDILKDKGLVKGLSAKARNLSRINTVNALKRGKKDVEARLAKIRGTENPDERAKLVKALDKDVKELTALKNKAGRNVQVFGQKSEPLVKENNETFQAVTALLTAVSEGNFEAVASSEDSTTSTTPTTPAGKLADQIGKLDLTDMVGTAVSTVESLSVRLKGTKPEDTSSGELDKVSTQLGRVQAAVAECFGRIEWLTEHMVAEGAEAPAEAQTETSTTSKTRRPRKAAASK